jgi:hypothetical protein
MSSKAADRLGNFRAQALQLPGDDLFYQQRLQTDSISGQSWDTTVQVWTVGKGLGIGSEFSQTCCAANNFRDHEVLFPRFKGTGD